MILVRPQRVLSVDVLRGITIAFMILVNDPGDWQHVYEQLDHAEWSGWTLTDLVFPNFLFLIGVSIILSLQGRIARGDSKAKLAGHMTRRAAILFAIKLLTSAYPHFHLGHLRLYGVLTRIALCYLAAGLICLMTRRVRVLGGLVIALLVGYWALMRFVPVPGFGVPTVDVPLLDHDGNLTAWIDRGFNAWTQAHLHTGSLYRKTNDPEGLLSTLPAIATTLIGAIAGLVMRREALTKGMRCRIFAGAGVLLVAGGELWSPTFPINKNLWTSSYVLLTAGISLLGLALFYWLVDIEGVGERSRVGRAMLWPWLVFGSNAIVAYVLSEVLVETMDWITVREGGRRVTAWSWAYVHGFARGHSTELTSVCFAMAFVAVCFIPSWLLWRKQIFIKI